jgi:hypothetical protein
LLDAAQVVHGQPRQGNSWVTNPDTFTLGRLKIHGQGREAFGAHHLAGGLEAEDRIPGAIGIPGSQRYPQLFDPQRQGGDEVLHKYPPHVVLTEVLAQPVQDYMVQERL